MKLLKQSTAFFLSICLLLQSPVSFAEEMCVCTEGIPLTLEISALYPAPDEGEEEWVEINNLGNSPVDLSYYTLQDNTENPWQLSGTLAAEESITITDLPFQLNNGGDTVTLETIEVEWIDSLTYESSSTGQVIYKEKTVELTEEDLNTEAHTEENLEPSTPSLWPLFSEALPNPEGSDSTYEWIELYNPYTETLQLEGLYLDDADGGSSPYALSGSLEAGNYLLIPVTESQLTLNNSSDSVRLLGVNDEVLWEVTYDDPDEGSSYILINEIYAWTTTPTAGSSNLLSTDEEESAPEYTNGDLSEDISLNEVYPNPEGADTENEWIEITNGGEESVNLGNWTIDDGEGGSNPYIFPDDTIINPGETLILYRTETGVALNNSNETVQLADYTGEVADEISYESSVEGQAYAKIQVEEVESTQASLNGLGQAMHETWEWVTPSPGEENPIWKQFAGTVIAFENDILSLEGVLQNWDLKVPTESFGASLGSAFFQKGNRILVQAAFINGFYEVRYSELLESAPVKDQASFPWGFVLSLLAASSWTIYEFWWKKKSLNSSQNPLI